MHYPLNWPLGWKRTAKPERSRFGTWNTKPSIAQATNNLLHELKLFKVKSVVISTNLKVYKADGTPYSNQKEPDDQGVAIYFKYNDQEMTIACDSFDKIGCNIYAIAKTIEAMRGINRWGCSELLNRAFVGFKALPEQASVNAEPWWMVLDVHADATADEIKTAWKAKLKIHHPDVGGDREVYEKIQKAYQQAIEIVKP